MAVSYIAGLQTDNFTPAFNQVNYYFDSTNKNAAGFRYIVNVYISGTSTLIHQTRVAPRPVDGYAFIRLGGVMQKLVTASINTGTTHSDATASWFRFDLKVGEEYLTSWDYTNYGQQTTGTYTGYTKLFQSPTATPHTFVVGDQINVSQTDGGVVKPMLQGLFTVVAVPDAYTVVLDILWANVGTGATMGGSITWADNRKTSFPNLATQTATVFNGALKFKDFPSFVSSDYKMLAPSTTNRMLTSLPDTGFTIRTTQDLIANVCNFFTTSVATYVYFQNSNGDILRKTTGSSSTSAIRQVTIGPNNVGALTVVSGTLPLIKSDTTYYDVWIVSNALGQASRKYRISIDRTCSISDIEVMYMDRFGGFLSIPFIGRDVQNISVDKVTGVFDFGTIRSGKWNYLSSEAGEKTTSATRSDSLVLRTGILNDEMIQALGDLVSSSLTLVKINGAYYQCTVQDKDITLSKLRDKRINTKEITIKLSQNEIINQ